jgi:hypothetical protein
VKLCITVVLVQSTLSSLNRAWRTVLVVQADSHLPLERVADFLSCHPHHMHHFALYGLSFRLERSKIQVHHAARSVPMSPLPATHTAHPDNLSKISQSKGSLCPKAIPGLCRLCRLPAAHPVIALASPLLCHLHRWCAEVST